MESATHPTPSTPSPTPRRPWVEVRAILEDRGLNIGAFSRLSGINLDTLRFYLHGRKHPTRDLVERIAAALGVDPVDIAPPPPPSKPKPNRWSLEAARLRSTNQ